MFKLGVWTHVKLIIFKIIYKQKLENLNVDQCKITVDKYFIYNCYECFSPIKLQTLTCYIQAPINNVK